MFLSRSLLRASPLLASHLRPRLPFRPLPRVLAFTTTSIPPAIPRNAPEALWDQLEIEISDAQGDSPSPSLGLKTLGEDSPFKLEMVKPGVYSADRTIHGYRVSVKFDTLDYQVEYEEEEEEEEFEEEEEGEKKIEEEEEEVVEKRSMQTSVTISPIGGTGKVFKVNGTIMESFGVGGGEGGELVSTFEYEPAEILVKKPGEKDEDQFSPDLDSLNDEMAEAILDWLETFGLDNELLSEIMKIADEEDSARYLDWLTSVKSIVAKDSNITKKKD